MSTISPERMIGIVLGITVGILLTIVIIGITHKTKDGKMGKCEYDERQEALRGKSFKVGFYATLTYVVILLAINAIGIELPVERPVIYFSIIFVGILAMVSHSLWTGAYWGINSDRRRFIIIELFVSLVNFVVPVRFMLDGSFITNGKIGASAINLLCGILFLCIFIQDAIKNAISSKEDDNE